MSWVQKLSDEQKEGKPFSERGMVLLLYGDCGTGKTYTAFTFPEPLFVIDTESRAINTKYDCEEFKDKQIEIFEPMETKDLVIKDGDVFDEHKSIENISQAIVEIAGKVKSGEIKQGTIILDSATDLWSWIQEWMRVELAKVQNKDGSRKANTIMMSVNNQLDWKIANRRHYDIVNSLRALTKYGINVVLTARESDIPDYVAKTGVTSKDRIRAHKDLPFLADVTFYLKKTASQQGMLYQSFCEKLRGKPIPTNPINGLSYTKIKEVLK